MRQFPSRRSQQHDPENLQPKRGPRFLGETARFSTDQAVPDPLIPSVEQRAPIKGARAFGHSIARIPIFPPQRQQRENSSQTEDSRFLSTGLQSPAEQNKALASPSLSAVLQRARVERTQALDASVRRSVEDHLRQKMGQVLIHSGPTSARVAEALNAQAFTLGRDIYLGAQAPTLNERERRRLLAHEAVHTVQQGGRSEAVQAKLQVSHPSDTAEIEAEQIATSVTNAATTPPSSSRSLALRDQFRSATAPLAQQAYVQRISPLIQRDLKKTVSLGNGYGDFKLDFKSYSQLREQAGGQRGRKRKRAKKKKPETGLKGDIKFTPSVGSPQRDHIKLLQTSKLTLLTGNEYTWTGGEAQREQVRTTAGGGGIEAGYFVDTNYEPYTTRTAQADDAISPYYIDLKGGGTDGGQEGYHNILKQPPRQDATLEDEPSCEAPATFRFETIAKDVGTGTVYGGVQWEFEVTQVAKRKLRSGKRTGPVDHSTAIVSKEDAKAINAPTATFDEALRKFNEHFANPGSQAGLVLP